MEKIDVRHYCRYKLMFISEALTGSNSTYFKKVFQHAGDLAVHYSFSVITSSEVNYSVITSRHCNRL